MGGEDVPTVVEVRRWSLLVSGSLIVVVGCDDSPVVVCRRRAATRVGICVQPLPALYATKRG
jgi:hypothetical protein